MNVCEITKNYKLGTKWLHKPTDVVHELRRRTHPKTLVGTRYFFNRENSTTVYADETPENWECIKP